MGVGAFGQQVGGAFSLAQSREIKVLSVRIRTMLTSAMNPENTNETPTKRRTLPEAAKPYRWRKGCASPNPGGRPKTAYISEALRRAVEEGEAEQLASILLALATGKKRGSNVQIAALREIADRTEGKARQSIAVDADFSATLAERIAEARKRVADARTIGHLQED